MNPKIFQNFPKLDLKLDPERFTFWHRIPGQFVIS